MASNGKLPKSQLRRIYHPQHKLYLEKDAAASWNTLRIFCKRYLRIDIYPAGPISAYRTYEQQVEAKEIYGPNAATPGTSNHGWGLAVDLATQTMRAAIDRVGAYFGWAKKWSDASWEWWHLKYRPGVWDRPDPGISNKYPVARKGSGGRGQKWYVRKIQRRLRAHGYPVKNSGGEFNEEVRRAVWAFQKEKKLHTDGIVGKKTWKKLNAKPKPNNKPLDPKPPQPQKPIKPMPRPQPKPPQKPEKPTEKPEPPKDPNKPKPKPPEGNKPPETPKRPAKIIDVSNHQPKIDWQQVAEDKVRGAYLKLSEGEDWRDQTTNKDRVAQIKAAGMKYGYYHFLRPKKRDAAKEARFFIEQAKSISSKNIWGDMPPVADIEVTELNPKETGEYLARFLNILRTEGNVNTILVYASPGWWESYVMRTVRLTEELKHTEAWIAHWNTKKPDELKGIPGYVLHQWTDSAKVKGILSPVDMNTAPDLKALLLKR